MFKNSFVISYRNLLRNKGFSFINLTGLITGFAACIFLVQFVSFELSFDDFHARGNRIFRLTNDRYQEGKRIHHGVTTYPAAGPALVKDYPEIEEHTRWMLGFNEMNVKIGNEIHTGGTYFFADEKFLSVFTFGLLAGNPRTALTDPYSVVLTKDQAVRYFGIQEHDIDQLLGRNIYFNLNRQPYIVTGICENPPVNSHLDFDALVSYATLIKNFPIADNSWTWSDMRHYVVLKPGTDWKLFQSKLQDFSERYFDGTRVTGSREEFYLQPLGDIHLYSDYEYDVARTSNGKVVWGMLIVAFFILGLALINYVNLTVAHSLKRAKEVSLRKVMGALKRQISGQFLAESCIRLSACLALAIVLVAVLQSQFNRLLGVELSLVRLVSGWDFLATIFFGSLMLLVVLAAGAYPAFLLSSFLPVAVLKGKFTYSSGKYIRKILVGFQFAACTVLLISTLIISAQLHYMNEVDLGIDLHNTVVINAPVRTAWDSTFFDRIKNFKNEMLNVSGVHYVTSSNKLPGERLPRIFRVHVKDRPSQDYHTMSTAGVGMDFFAAYKIKVVAGRVFSHEDFKLRWSDIKSVIINESAAKTLGFVNPETALGQEIFLENRFFTVIGVVVDFHQESLKSAKEPMLFRPVFGNAQAVSLKLEKPDPKIINAASVLFKKFFPDNAFDYYHLEERFNARYTDDFRFDKVIRIFSYLAILISCLGLIGLSSYSITQRTREIGIRKVLGASVSHILAVLSAEFVRLILMALAFSLPVGYLVMQYWLSGYMYRISPGPLFYIIPSVVVLIIALVTISFQVIRTASVNPADTIKYE